MEIEEIGLETEELEGKIKVGEKSINIIGVVVSILFLYEASKISGIVPKPEAPGALPTFISWLMIICGVWIFVEDKRKKASHSYETTKAKVTAMRELVFSNDIVVMIFLLIAYSVLLGILGFVITTALFLWISMVYLTSGNYLKNLGYSALCLGIIMIIFKVIFKVILP